LTQTERKTLTALLSDVVGHMAAGSQQPRTRPADRWPLCLAAGWEKAATRRLGLSHSTVKRHLANVRSRFGATTRAQLVWILAARLPDPPATVHAEE
jgi:hypothetical protein